MKFFQVRLLVSLYKDLCSKIGRTNHFLNFGRFLAIFEPQYAVSTAKIFWKLINTDWGYGAETPKKKP